MISIDNLNLSYADRTILSDVSFEIADGETLAIVGESGAGKTSLARLLLGLLEGSCGDRENDHRGFRWSGRAMVDTVDVLRAGEKRMRRFRGSGIGMIVQALSDALNPHLTVRQHLLEIPELRRASPAKLAKACDEWNLPERIRDRYPASLSGGEIQRVLTALALLPRPKNLILDEPTASLDLQNRTKAIEALCRDQSSRCQLLITHDLELARQIAKRTAVMKNGRLVETGPTKAVLMKPGNAYTRSLLEAAREMKREPSTTDFVSVSQLRQTEERPNADGLHVCRLSHCYSGRRVLNDLSFHVPKGGSLAILGESGSGKSTLARILTGYLPLQAGEIRWRDSDPKIVAAFSSGFRSALVSQHPHRAMPHHFTGMDVLCEAIHFRRVQNTSVKSRSVIEDRKEMQELLDLVGLGSGQEFLTKPTAVQSGGEAQRLVVARALSAKPDLLILDEPTASLDATTRVNMLKVLKGIQRELNLTLILVTHEPDVAKYLADTAIHLQAS